MAHSRITVAEQCPRVTTQGPIRFKKRAPTPTDLKYDVKPEEEASPLISLSIFVNNEPVVIGKSQVYDLYEETLRRMQQELISSCCWSMTNMGKLNNLRKKIEFCQAHQTRLSLLPPDQQKKVIDEEFCISTNFSDDKGGDILSELSVEMGLYLQSSSRFFSKKTIPCNEYTDGKGKKKNFMYAGRAKQILFSELAENLQNPNPNRSMLKIINEWKNKKTRYKKPNIDETL